MINENKTKEINRITFDGRKVPYSELPHQHLSNIIWFKRVLVNQSYKFELSIINEKFHGVILDYEPDVKFKQEIALLKSRGLLEEDGCIYFEGKRIGQIINHKS